MMNSLRFSFKIEVGGGKKKPKPWVGSVEMPAPLSPPRQSIVIKYHQPTNHAFCSSLNSHSHVSNHAQSQRRK